jgi:succinyl-CoA synthetase beta subunit
MRLYEYEAYELFRQHNIPLPRFRVVDGAASAEEAAREIGCPVVLKAQVLVGGRGKAGGIRRAETPSEAAKLAAEMIGSELKGERVEKLLVAEAVKGHSELYLSCVVDRSQNSHTVLASRMGGVDVEELLRSRPESLVRIAVDPLVGLQDWQLRRLSRRLGLGAEASQRLEAVCRGLYDLYTRYYCDLAEINPLALLPDGRLMALDAKIIIDDNAARIYKYSFRDAESSIASRYRLNYVELDGEVGIICNGAGLTMATMDLVFTYGGKPACFLDLGGGASPEQVYHALRIVYEQRGVRAALINVLAGITRCDEVATGIVKAVDALGLDASRLVIRLVGTRQEEGWRILAEKGIASYRSMPEAVREAVKLASDTPGC